MTTEYIDHLKAHMKRQVERYLENCMPEDLPVEFRDIPQDRLEEMITDMATPILRKLEDDAISAAIERQAGMIRFAQRMAKDGVK